MIVNMKKLVLSNEQLKICNCIEQLFNLNNNIYQIKTDILFSSTFEENLDFYEDEFDIVQTSLYECACNLFLQILKQLDGFDENNEDNYIDEFRDNWFYKNEHISFASWLDKLYIRGVENE